MKVIIAVAAAFLGSAIAAGINEERRGLLLRRESNDETTEPSIPCGDGTGVTKEWSKPGLPCNYKKSVSAYPGRLPYPEPLVESDVNVVLNRSRADELGYGDLYTTTEGPSTSGFAPAMKPLTSGTESAKSTTAQPVPDGLKEVFEWKKAHRSVDTPELKFPKVPEKPEENATVPTPAPTLLEGGAYYRPHFAGDGQEYLDEDPKMQKMPQIQTLKDSVEIFNGTTGKISSKKDMPSLANPNATQTRSSKKQRYVALLKSDEVKDIEGIPKKKKALHGLRESQNREQSSFGDIPRDSKY